jgi:hypothetical protein
MKQLTQEQLSVVHHPLGQHARVLAVAGYACSIYTGILYGVLQIPQYVEGKGIVRKILGMPIKSLHPTFFHFAPKYR